MSSIDQKNLLAFGIDLGTTNSAIAVVGNGNKPDIISVDGQSTMPSCVMWNGGNNFVVGSEAFKHRDRPNVCYSVKRLMGTDKKVKLIYDGIEREFAPWEMSREILKALVEKAKVGLYKDINDVVISVPAYFSDKQISDTLKAGKAAGLNVLSLIKEPTAACLLYNQQFESSGSKTVLVYDLGGGTFDISVVMISNTGNTNSEIAALYDLVSVESKTLFSVLKVSGDPRLGGDDVDSELLSRILDNLAKQNINKGDITRGMRERLLLRAEYAKKKGIAAYMETMTFNNKTAEFTLNPSDFYVAFDSVYNKTKRLLDNVLSDSALFKIDQIITIGGSTKSEYIRSKLQNDFPGVSINFGLNPDESVALGAAIQAKRLKFGDDTVNVLDCLPMDIGVISEDFVDPILKAGMQIPCTVSRTFLTQEKGQNQVELLFYQGNSRYSEECEFLGSLKLDNTALTDTSHSRVLVELSIDSNGLLVVKSAAGNSGLQRRELVNLLGKTSVDTPKITADKRVIRWKSFANRLEPDKKEELLCLLDLYIDGLVNESDVVSFIRDNKPTVEVSTDFKVRYDD